jgi:hypothetical protein
MKTLHRERLIAETKEYWSGGGKQAMAKMVGKELRKRIRS